MAIYQPSFVFPDTRSGIGQGVIDATQDLTVSWHINGPSALTSFAIAIYINDSGSTLKYSTGQITAGCPAYGTTSAGEPQMFSYTISAATLAANSITNGNEYKIIITQWWSVSGYVVQSSASAFITRAKPTLSVSAIGTAGVIASNKYTFTGNYDQAQGDTLNYFRWQIAYADDLSNPFFDSENISGTMDISCSYDGFLTGVDYSIRLTVQTENGVEVNTGWIDFSCNYLVPNVPGLLEAGCVGGTDAVLINWSGIGYIGGKPVGTYYIQNDILYLGDSSTVTWDQVGAASLQFDEPWSVVWKGIVYNAATTLFSVDMDNSGTTTTISLVFDNAANALKLVSETNGVTTTLATQSGILNNPLVTVVLASDALYIRAEYIGGGLYPSSTLYPSNTLYPAEDNQLIVNTYTKSLTYRQYAITSVVLTGPQQCDYIEVLIGDPTAEIIAQAITNGTYDPYLSSGDYMLCNFTNGLNAGTLDIDGNILVGFALYRRQENSKTLVKVADTDTSMVKVYDYGALSQQGPYIYYLFPVGEDAYIGSPIISGTVMPCWWNWTLMVCEETNDPNIFFVNAAYRFRYNIETGAIQNNNAPNILPNFTPYPKVQLAPQNYKSSTLVGLIGVIDWTSGQPEYVDTIALRDAIYALSVTDKPLFLKSRKGELIRIKIAGSISMQTGDALQEQPQTMTLPWVEIGSAENVSLYSLEYAGVQEAEGEFTPQYFVDVSDATADAANIRVKKTAYGRDGKITGDAEVSVSENALIMPIGMEE